MSRTGLAGIIALASVLGACADAERAESETSAGANDRRGGWVVICSEGAPESLNPFVSPNLTAIDLGALLYTPLLRYDSDAEFRPYLAADWSWSPDRQTLRFHIRGDVTWHDGAPVRAGDVVWTVESAADPEFGYAGGADLSTLAKALAVDSLTVELQFDGAAAAGLEPFVSLPVLPAHLLERIPPGEFRTAAYHRSPVGSGPFKFSSRTSDGAIVFERWDEFPAELGRPLIDRAIFRAIAEPTALVAELETGAVDVCVTRMALGDRLRGSERLEVQPVTPSHTGVQAIFLNTAHPPLDDVRVRRAISAALDRSELAAVVSALATSAGNPLVPATRWHDPDIRQPDADATLADSLLRAAGWNRPGPDAMSVDSEGRELRFTVVAPTQAEPVLTAVQAQLRRLGIDLELHFMEFAALVSTIMNVETRPDAVSLALYENKLVRPDLFNLLHSEGGQNLSSYSDPVVDSLLSRLQTGLDESELGDIYRRLQVEVAEDVPIVYTIYVSRLLADGPRVDGVSPDLSGPFGSVASWWIPPSQRRRR